MNEFLTPANQQRTATDHLQQPGGSASTIVDPSASAQVSSAINTPHDAASSTAVAEKHNYRVQNASPLDTRPHLNESSTEHQQGRDKDIDPTARDLGSSPLISRAYLNTSAARPPAIAAGTGRFSVR